MADYEDGACFNIWLRTSLTDREKSLLKEYEIFFQPYGHRFSFVHGFKILYLTNYEKSQLLKTIGYIPEEELYICGLATPLFRSIEAILKYFGGFAKIGSGETKDNPEIKGVYYEIRKSRLYYNHLYPLSYYLIDWEIVANVYNTYDTPKIREFYSIQNFVSNI